MPPLVLAHRGARTVAPENTIEAFTVALAQGADGVELDVHRTADGGLVVHHDADAPGLGVLAELDLAEIRGSRPEIPTLVEVLDSCRGALVNVEVKNMPGDADYDDSHVVARLVVELLESRGFEDDVLVSSFNLASIDRVRELAPTVPTGLLSMFGVDPFDALELCVARGHGALHPFIGILPAGAATAVAGRAHDLGLRVNVWTVNDGDEIARLAAAGIDGIMTDVPDLARASLAA